MSGRKLSLKEVKVSLDFGDEIIPVGRLAIRNRTIYFEYYRSFTDLGLNISPIKLPPEIGLRTFNPHLFDGLPGVFNDSLPDGWGRLLLNRYWRSRNRLPEEFSPLDRLACVGYTGLGALVYEPDYSEDDKKEYIDMDTLAGKIQQVMNGEADNVLRELIAMNGSSAGARPKAMIGIDEERKYIIHGRDALPQNYAHWMVKFANSTDGIDAGAIEYVYALMAKEAGISMMPVHLFPAVRGAGYFATKRFDRHGNKRLHMHTAGGLLHSDFRVPSLDYEHLLALTEILTRDLREVEMMYRLAVFNVLSHNRDDHGKNFSFLMDRAGAWKLAPGYDLTFSSGPRGHQSTMVMGEGQTPSADDLTKLGAVACLKQSKVREIIEQTRHALNRWEILAANYGVSKANIKFIKKRML